MQIHEIKYQGRMTTRQEWPQENIIEVEKANLRDVVEQISRSNRCRYPLLAIRILIQAMTNIDENGKVYISARQLAKSLDAHYDTVTKCLKYLREIGVLSLDK